MDFRHLVADDDLRTELLDKIKGLTLVPVAFRDGALESLSGLEGGSDAFREVEASTLEAGVHRMYEGSWVAVVGYPARSPYNNLQDQQRIFDGGIEHQRNRAVQAPIVKERLAAHR